jgi:putative membrane protein
MLISMLGVLLLAQVPTVGPKAGPAPKPVTVVRSDDGAVLGAVGARDANMIEVSKLATTKASSSEVKALATDMLKDHQLSLTTGAKLAKQYHLVRLLPADSAMARAQVDEMAALNALSGASFDKAFVQFVAADHKAAIAKASGSQLDLATRPQVRAFVRQRLPVLQRHQLAAEKWLAAHP